MLIYEDNGKGIPFDEKKRYSNSGLAWEPVLACS